MPYAQLLYHIVFSTKFRGHTIPKQASEKLYRYIWSLVLEKNCVLYQIGGVADHLHILCNIHPSISLSDFVQYIKGKSSKWLAYQAEFPAFAGWAKSYAVLTYNIKEKPILIAYIKNQENHHKKESLDDELNRLLMEN